MTPAPNERRRSNARRLEYRQTYGVACPVERAFEPLYRLGGEHGWFYANPLWSLRAAMDRWVGGPGAVKRPTGSRLAVGDAVGMFRVARLCPPHELLLEGRMKVPGAAWLRFDVADLNGNGSRISVTATLETGSWIGRAYWASFFVPHAILFRGLLRRLAQAAGCSAMSSAEPSITAEHPAYRPDAEERPSPCMVGCPSGTDIRGWITTVAQRRTLGISDDEAYERAWRTITDMNPFPAVTGRICPHPCETGCNRHDKDGSVSVKEMERFIGDWAIDQRLELQRQEEDRKPESVGVIGSGPAGLSFAYQMARRGYAVTVYERESVAGGMLRHGIPLYRLPAEVVDAEIARIVDLGVDLRTGVRIGDDVTIADLRERHAAVFLGIGASAGRPLGIPGERGPGVTAATDYLARAVGGERVETGGQVVVIGGGDVAMDAARTARRSGAAVTVVYRRTRDEMPAAASEIDEASIEGVQFEFLAAPVAILRNADAPHAIVIRRMRLGEPDASGRPRPVPVAGTDFRIPATTVMTAVSRGPDWDGIEIAEEELNRAGATGLVAGGDVLAPGIASGAIANGRHAAETIHARLRGLPPLEPAALEPVRVGDVRPQDYDERDRTTAPVRDPSAWLAVPEAEIHAGITEAQFLAEAERCLSCGSCFGCERCFMYCAHGCFSRLEEVRPGAYFALDLDQCRACGKCVDLCPCGYLGETGIDAVPR